MQRILVAGDNEDATRVHECLRTHYTRRGCSVAYCPTPGELIRLLQPTPPDAVFLHFQFSELTVYEIYQQLRSLREGRNLPIFVIETEMLGGSNAPGEALVLLKMPLTVSELVRRFSLILHQDVATTDPSVLCEPTFMQFEDEAPDAAAQAEAEAEERRRELLRQHSIQLRDEVPAQGNVYLIPEKVRRRLFYNSDFVQGILDRIEDSDWYQNRCRRKYGVQAAPPEAPPEEAAAEAEAAPEKAPAPGEKAVPVFAATPRAPGPGGITPRKTRQGGKSPVLAILLTLAFLALGLAALAFLGAQLLRANTYCEACDKQAGQVVLNIHGATCPSCAGPVGFACKCEECDHTFAFVPGRDVKTRFGASKAPPCPECGSPKTVRLGH